MWKTACLRILITQTRPMKERFDLSIPEPCHEKWENFAPTPGGGYCSNCRKEVIDFTHWSETEILKYFKNINRPTCGRFRKDQLKTYSGKDFQPRQKFIPLSALSLALLLTSNEANATERRCAAMEIVSLENTSITTEVSQGDTTKARTISGTITAEDDYLLPGVNVVLKGTALHTATDAHGKFTLEIPDPRESDVLVFAFIGYETVEKAIAASNNLLIRMQPDTAILGEPVFVGGVYVRRWTPGGIWWHIKNLFR